MLLIFFSTMIIMSIILIFLNHPLSFGLILLIQTTLIALTTGTMNYNYWFSYIVFLIMIGGMLILFIYMTSVASNEKFKFSSKLFTLISSTFILILLGFITDSSYYFNLIMSNSLNNFDKMSNLYLSMNKFLSWPMNLIFYLIIIYLLITLIMVVKVTNLKSGPLRQKF